jgi:glycosyltransferase involved in cell wall biosynthesis
VHLTVAICTHNRAAQLRETLECLESLIPPLPNTWELVVVANACTDATERVLSEFCDRLPLRSVSEPAPGLSNARNRAVAEATGEYLVWTDDDVLVERDWLVEYVSAFRAHPGATFFGGPIEPVFQSTPPRWLIELLPAVGAAFSRRQLSDQPFQVDGRTLPYGANFAVRTVVQRSFRYHAALGQQPGRLGVGEETQVLFAMLRKGHAGWWVPTARVRHVIPPERQRWEHVLAHWRAQGRAMAIQFRPVAGPRLLNRPLRIWRFAITAECAYRLRRVTRSRAACIDQLARARMGWGLLEAANRIPRL